MPRSDWSELRSLRARTHTLLFFFLLTGLPLFSRASQWSSSSPSAPPPPEEAADLVRDAPLYPPLAHLPLDPSYGGSLDSSTGNLDSNYGNLESLNGIEDSTLLATSDERLTQTEQGINVQKDEERAKRSSGQQWENSAKQTSRRVKTGDTILNIRGAVRDAIGDAGAAPVARLGTPHVLGGRAPPSSRAGAPRAGSPRAAVHLNGPRASTRLDTFVIRPEPAPRPPHDNIRQQPASNQPPKQEREVLVEAHSRALIPCDLHNITNLRWYKDNEQMPVPSGGVEMGAGGIVISRATRADAALWRCAGETTDGATVSGKPARLLIYEPVRSVYLAVDGRRLDAGNTWVPVRDKTVLEVRCVAEGGVPPPELTWRLSALEPALDHRPYLRIHQTNYSLDGVSWSPVVVTAARELHNATLSCAASQRAPASASQQVEPMTAKLEIHVTYPPSFVISRWPGFGVSLWAGSAAALRCDVDANPPARAFWLRDDAHTTSSPPPLSAAPESPGSATLRWAALRPAHAGWYRCRATWLHTEYSSIGYYLNVMSPEDGQEPPREAESQPEAEEPPHQKVDVPLGGNVQLHCPKGSVGCWWRRVVGNGTEGWAPAGSHHAHGVLGIKDALYQEGGEYRCVGARAQDMQRISELKRVTLRVTGGATATALSAEPATNGWRLECGACGRGVKVWWVRTPSAGGRDDPPLPAKLSPDLAQHCWRAVLHTTEPDEMWCVAVAGTGGAVAVFPARRPLAASPAPARRALSANAISLTPVNTIIAVLLTLALFGQFEFTP